MLLEQSSLNSATQKCIRCFHSFCFLLLFSSYRIIDPGIIAHKEILITKPSQEYNFELNAYTYESYPKPQLDFYIKLSF